LERCGRLKPEASKSIIKFQVQLGEVNSAALLDPRAAFEKAVSQEQKMAEKRQAQIKERKQKSGGKQGGVMEYPPPAN